MAEQIFRQTLATVGLVGGHGLFAAVVDVEAGVFPGEEVGEFGGTDEFGVTESVEEVVAKEFDGGSKVVGGHAVEAAIRGEESVGGKDMEVGVVDEIVSEGVEGGDVKEEGEEATAFAEDSAQDAGDGEDELAVRDFVADGGCDPFAGGADAALVAGGAEVAALAGEGEEAFVAAVRALKAGETGSEVTAAEEGLDGADGGGRKRAEGFAVMFLVVGEEVIPAVVDELPEGRSAGTSWLVDGRHKKCS